MAEDEIADAERAARQQIANAKRRHVLHTHQRAMWAAIETLQTVHGDFDELTGEKRALARTMLHEWWAAAREVSRLEDEGCADEDESFDKATRRIWAERLLRQGIKPYEVGRLANPDLDSSEIANTTEKKTARVVLKRLRTEIESELAHLRSRPPTKFDGMISDRETELTALLESLPRLGTRAQ